MIFFFFWWWEKTLTWIARRLISVSECSFEFYPRILVLLVYSSVYWWLIWTWLILIMTRRWGSGSIKLFRKDSIRKDRWSKILVETLESVNWRSVLLKDRSLKAPHEDHWQCLHSPLWGNKHGVLTTKVVNYQPIGRSGHRYRKL